MICPRCTSERSFRFEAGKDARVKPEGLPVVCRDCGLITINGIAAAFPPELELQAKSMAEAAEAIGQQALSELRNNQDLKISSYFERVYRSAYLDGFFRAVLFFRHEKKGGRLKRLRELWRAVLDTEVGDFGVVKVRMPSEVYAEFEKLIVLGAPGDQDAASPTNPGSSVSRSHARVPG